MINLSKLFGGKKDLTIFPSLASQSVSSLALLFLTNGFPFSSYKSDDIETNELEDSFIKPACHCYMLYLYPTYFESLRMGETLLGSALAVAKKQNEKLIDLIEFGLSIINESFFIAAYEFSGSEDSTSKIISTFSYSWINFMDSDKELNEQQKDDLHKKLYQCLCHSSSVVSKSLKYMIECIDTFDLKDINDITFKKIKIGLIEKTLKDRIERPYLYPHKSHPTAQELYEARENEANILKELQNNYESIKQKLNHEIQSASSADEVHDAIKNYVFGVGDLKAEAKRIGTNYADILIQNIDLKNEELYPSLKAAFISLLNDEEGEKYFNNLLAMHESYRLIEVMSTIKYIDNDILASYILGLDDEDFEVVAKESGIEKSLFEEYLTSTQMFSYCTEEQKEHISNRINQFS